MNVKINNNALNKITNQQVGPIVGKKIEKSLIQNVQKAQREMIQELESHPVTKEIESGPNGTNQSGTLGGYGNLFSFIGFERGMSPINPIRKIIKKVRIFCFNKAINHLYHFIDKLSGAWHD